MPGVYYRSVYTPIPRPKRFVWGYAVAGVEYPKTGLSIIGKKPLSTAVLDNFNRADAANLGGSWLDMPSRGLPTHRIISNQAGLTTGYASNYWSTQLGADQEAWMTVAALPNVDWIRLMCRLQNPDGFNEHAYWITIFDSGDWYLEKAADNLQDNFTLQALGNAGDFQAGWKVGLSCIGDQIRCYKDTGTGWQQVGTTVTDTTVTGPGYVGFYTGNTTTVRIDDFGGGAVVADGMAASGRKQTTLNKTGTAKIGAQYAKEVLNDSPVGYWRLNEQSVTPVEFTASSGLCKITAGLGAVDLYSGYTIAALIRPKAAAKYQQIIGVETAAPLDVLSIELNASDVPVLSQDGAEIGPSGVALQADQWFLVAFTKAAGTSFPRAHFYNFTLGTWYRADSPSNPGNPARTPSANVVIGEWQNSDTADVHGAVWGIWNTNLSDAQIDTLPVSLTAWGALDPDWWAIANGDIPLVDESGGGGNEISRQAGVTASAVVTPYAPFPQDSSGKRNHATAVGTGVHYRQAGLLTTEREDDCMSFDGSGGWVSVPDNPSLNITGELTMEAWIYPTALDDPSTYNFVMGKYAATNDGGYDLYVMNDGRVHAAIRGGGFAWEPFSPVGTIEVGNLYHVVVTYENLHYGTTTIYVNGAQVFQGFTGVVLAGNTGDFTIGARGIPPDELHWTGRIDEVAVYPTCLSEARVKTHYAEGASAYAKEVLTDAPRAYYRMNEAQPFTTPVLDNFNRANENPIATNWSGPIFGSDGQLAIVSNQATALAGGYYGSYYDLATYTNCEAYVTLAAVPSSTQSAHVWARLAGVGGDATGYNVYYVPSGPASVYIIRGDGASGQTNLGSFPVTLSAGDKLGIRCIGSSIEAWYKPAAGVWKILGTRNDATYTSGYLGLEMLQGTTVFDDFGGGPATADLPQDFSGNGNNAWSASGSATYEQTGGITTDPTNQAIKLNKVDDEYFTVPDHATLDLGDVWSIEAWIKRNAITGSEEIIVAKFNGGYALGLEIGTGNVILGRSNVQIIAASTVAISETNTYHHLVGTKNGSDIHIYIDGVDRTNFGTTNNSTCVNTATELFIGSESGSSFADLTLDEVAIYPTALSAARVLTHYNASLVSVSGMGASGKDATTYNRSGLAATGSLVFPSTGVLDTFNRANADPITGNWADLIPGVIGHQRINGNLMRMDGSSFGASYYTTPFGPDCENYISIAAIPDDGDSIFLYSRLREVGTTGVDGYTLQIIGQAGGTGDYIALGVMTNGSVGNVNSTTAYEIAVGDKIGMRCIGTVIEAWYCPVSTGVWKLLFAITDSTYTTAGYLGVGGGTGSAQLNDFGGGTVNVGPLSIPVLDNFNRSDENPATTNWTTPMRTGDANVRVSGNKIISEYTGGDSSAYYDISAFGADCGVYATVVDAPVSGDVYNLYLRMQGVGTSSTRGYSLGLVPGGTDQWAIFKVTAGAGVEVGLYEPQEVAAGDSIGLTAVGSTLQMWYRPSGGEWARLGDPRTDTAYRNGGYVGAKIQQSTATVVGLDNFGGGPLNAGGMVGSGAKQTTLNKTGTAATGRAVLRKNNAEGGSNGTTVTTGNSGGVSGDAWNSVFIGGAGAFTFDNTHPAHGALSYKVAVSGGAIVASWPPIAPSITECWGRFYVWSSNFISHNPMWVKNVGSQGGAGIYTTASGQIRLMDSTGAITDGTVAIPNNALSRIEFHYVRGTTTGLIEAKLFTSPESTTPAETITFANRNTRGDCDHVEFGNIDATTTTALWMDDPALSTTGWIGPIAEENGMVAAGAKQTTLSKTGTAATGKSIQPSGLPAISGSAVTINATGADRIIVPDTSFLSTTQMWIAMRVKPSWASSDATDRRFWTWGADTNNELFIQYGPTAGQASSGRDGAGGAGQPLLAGLSFSANTDHTLIAYVTASASAMSFDGANFVSASNTMVPDMTGVTGWDIGQRGYTYQGIIDSDVYWVATGLGTLTNANAATIHALGNTDPGISGFPVAANFFWAANSWQYVSPTGGMVASGVSVKIPGGAGNTYTKQGGTRNQAENQGVEQTLASEWAAESGVTATRVTAEHQSGVAALQVAGMTSSNGVAFLRRDATRYPVPNVNGTAALQTCAEVTASVYTKGGGADPVTMVLDFYNAGGTIVGSYNYSDVPTSTWTKWTVRGQASYDAVTCRVRFRMASGTQSANVYLDEISLVSTSPTANAANAVTYSRSGIAKIGTRADDNFNRANQDPIAGNWITAVGDGGTMKIASNSVTNSLTDTNNDGAIYTGITWPDDQSSAAKLSVNCTFGVRSGPALFVRHALAANTSYRISVDHAASTNCNISRFLAGTRTTLLDFTQAWTDGAEWKLTVDGPPSAARLRVYLNGTLIQTVTDNSSIASGYPGIGVSDNSNVLSVVVDDWVGEAQGMIAAGVANKTFAKTGIGIKVHTALGDAASTLNRTGIGIQNNRIASGVANKAFAQANIAIADFVAIGDGRNTLAETGAGIQNNRIGSGADATTYAETGVGISPRTVLGDAISTLNRTGNGIAVFTVLGDGFQTQANAGTGIATFVASGTNNKTVNRTGIAVIGTLAFPTTAMVDNFTGSDGSINARTASGGQTWSAPVWIGHTAASITSNAIVSPGSAGDYSAVISSATHQDSEVYATFSVVPPSSAFLFLRVGEDYGPTFPDTYGDGNYYQFRLATGNYDLTRIIGGVTNIILDGAGGWNSGGNLSNGDKVGISAVEEGANTRLRVYRTIGGVWKLQASVLDTDGVRPITGYIGFELDVSTTMDDFGGGTAVLNGFAASGTSQKVSGGIQYTKTGAGVADFVAIGDGRWTLAETGSGISDRVASGTKNFVLAKSGIGIAVFTVAGDGVQTQVTTGAGGAVFTANGVDATTFVETGAGVSPRTVLGDAVSTVNRTGIGISPRVGSGADAVTFTETGAGVINAFIGLGDATTATVKLGIAIAGFTASGADAVTSSETGIGISVRTASGADAMTFVETGAGVSDRTVLGDAVSTLTRTGIGIAPFTASGTRAKTSTRTGIGIAPFTASGPGVKQGGGTGIGIAAFVASGTDAHTAVETGSAVAVFTASGTKSKTATKTGAGISIFTGSGADVTTFVESGIGISVRVASGADVSTFTETGTGISPFVASAPSVEIQANTGIAIAPFVASGTRAVDHLRTGIAIATFVSSGADATTFVESGTAILTAIASGARSSVSGTQYVKTGAGVLVLTGSGADATTSAESGTGISGRDGSGARSATHPRTGTAASDFTGTADGRWQITDTGSGVLVATASGSRARTITKTGIAITAFVGSGADALTISDTGTGVAVFTVAGADATTYADTGAGVSTRVADADGRWIITDSGVGILDRKGGGTVTKQGEPTGTGVANFTGTAAATWTLTRTGVGIKVHTGSGADVWTTVDTGTAIAPFTASGARSVEHIRSGIAISAREGTAGATWTVNRSGVGIIDRTAAGDATSALIKRGTGIIGFTASGTGPKAGAKSGTAVAVFTALCAKIAEHPRVGAGITAFVAVGDSRVDYTEVGTGVVAFVTTGADAQVIAELGTGTINFTGTGDSSLALLRSGTGIIDFSGSGTRFALVGVFLGPITATVVPRTKPQATVMAVILDQQMIEVTLRTAPQVTVRKVSPL